MGAPEGRPKTVDGVHMSVAEIDEAPVSVRPRATRQMEAPTQTARSTD